MTAPDYTTAVADLNDSRRVRASDATLRDVFAAHALAGLLAAEASADSGGAMFVKESGEVKIMHKPENVARAAYQLADAMLAARSQQLQAT